MAIRTLYIQLIRGVDKNIVVRFPVEGNRGIIYDRNGKKMGYDMKVSDIMLKDANSENIYSAVLFMNRNFDLDIDSTIKKIKEVGSGSLQLLRNVNRNKINDLLDEINQIEDLYVTPEREERYYPQEDLGFHIIGSFRENGKGWGVENEMNKFLSAKKDSLSHFVLSSGKKIPAFENDDYEKLSGQDVFLTIDIDYQRILNEELSKQLKLTNSKYANGIIVNPLSGEILAMVTLPSANLNNPLKNFDLTINRTVNNSEEPGSTIKPFSVIAGLDNGIIQFSDQEYCEGSEEDGDEAEYIVPGTGGRTISDHEGRGTLSVKDILAYSNNIGTIKLALKIKKEPIYNTLKKFGFGEWTGIDFLKENKGSLKYLEEWDNYSRSSIPIGQEMRANNLQIAMAYSAIANGGYLIEPRLIKKISNHAIDNNPTIIRKVAKKETIKDIVEGLTAVVDKGTAAKYKESYCVYGKTGTAEVSRKAEKFIDVKNGVYDQGEEFTDGNKNGKWDEGEEFSDGNDIYDQGEDFIDCNEDLSICKGDDNWDSIMGNGVWDEARYSKSVYMPSFVGVFPCDSPKLVCVVSLFGPNKEDRWAGSTAVPVVQKIFKRLKLKDKDLIL